MRSYWITCPRQDQGRSPCGPFSALCAGGCNATGKGQEAGAQATWHRRSGWPCVRDTRPRPVPPVCSGAPSVAANGLTKRAQMPPLAISLTGSHDATSAPGRARVRATPGGALSPPPLCVSGGGHSVSGSGISNERGGLRQ